MNFPLKFPNNLPDGRTVETVRDCGAELMLAVDGIDGKNTRRRERAKRAAAVAGTTRWRAQNGWRWKARDGGDHPSRHTGNRNRTFYLYVKYQRANGQHKNFYVYLFFPCLFAVHRFCSHHQNRGGTHGWLSALGGWWSTDGD